MAVNIIQNPCDFFIFAGVFRINAAVIQEALFSRIRSSAARYSLRSCPANRGGAASSSSSRAHTEVRSFCQAGRIRMTFAGCPFT